MELFDESGCPVKLTAGGPSATGAAGEGTAVADSGAGAAARGGTVGAGPEIGGAGGGFGGLRTEELEEEEEEAEEAADDEGYEVGRSTPAATSSSRFLRFLAPGLPWPALLAAMRASSGGGAVSGKFTCNKVIVTRKT